MELSAGMFDEFYEELQWMHWHWILTKHSEKQINIALVKAFYSNIYDPKDDSMCRTLMNSLTPPTSLLMEKNNWHTPNTYTHTWIIRPSWQRYAHSEEDSS